jgi:hypothetical protein
MRDCAGILGAASLAYGAWLAYKPAGFIVAGLLLLAGSLLASRAAP